MSDIDMVEWNTCRFCVENIYLCRLLCQYWQATRWIKCVCCALFSFFPVRPTGKKIDSLFPQSKGKNARKILWKKSNTRRSIYLFKHMQRRTCEHFLYEKLIKIQIGLKWTLNKRPAQLLHKRFLSFNESKSGNNRNKLNLFCLNCAKR